MDNLNKPLVNRVAQSKLITVNLENYFPSWDIINIDLAAFLFQGLLLKEKDFRKSMKDLDWKSFEDKILLINCSTDAIIPIWAYALLATHASPFVRDLYVGTKKEYIKSYYNSILSSIDYSEFENKMIVIKGCSDKEIPILAYTQLSKNLTGIAKSIMYGEPCSTVPLYKKK